MIQQAVILAAGRGTRLGQLTKDRPKSMLPVAGKPIMARVMDRLHEAGIRHFVVVIGEQEGAIAAYLSSSWHPDAEIKFALQSVPTGTVDALLLAAPHLKGPFLLTAVDNLTSPQHINNLMASFEQPGDPVAALSLLPADPDQLRASSEVLIEDNWVTAIQEKPAQPRGTFASIMIYAFALRFLDFLPQVAVSPRGEREIASGIQSAIEQGEKVAYAITEWRLHLTHEIDLLAINRQFLQEGRDAHILSEIPSSVTIVPPVRIDPQVSVGQAARLGPNVYLESGAAVGAGAVLENTIVLAGATVSPDEHCHDEVIDRRVRISSTQRVEL